MEIYVKTIKVEQAHLDEIEHVNNVVFLQWIQDVSKEHWLAKTNDTMNASMYWVVRSHQLEYKKQVFLGDELIIKTHVANYKGPFSERVVEFYRNDVQVVKSISNWCLISRDDHKPMKISEDLQSLFK